MIEIAVRKHNGRSLIPVDEIAARELSRVPSNVDLLVKVTAPRNIKLLRFLWALADKVAEASEWLHDGDDAMDELKIRARHVKYLVNPTTGEVRIVPKSLTKIDGAALNRLANRMVYVVCRDIVPGLDETALRAEIVSMVAGPENSNSQEQASPRSIASADEPAATQTPVLAAGNQSQSSDASPADDEARAGKATDAGPPSTPEASDLSPDWQATYLRAMARVTDRPKSLTGRHAEALQLIGGKANTSEQEWMKAVYRLTERRLRGEISKEDCDAAVREIS